MEECIPDDSIPGEEISESLQSAYHQSKIFPSLETTDSDGIIGFSETMEIPMIIDAYRSGIFPWPMPEIDIVPWFAPLERAVIFFDQFKISKRTKRQIRSSGFTAACNTAFREVMIKCSEPENRKYKRKSDRKIASWITPDMIDAYCTLNEMGLAHSIEIYADKELVGGVYGVAIGSFFAAESMFYRKTDASKAALLYLVSILESQGATFIDCQELNSHLESLGAIEISRKAFMKIQQDAIKKRPLVFPSGPLSIDLL